ncbi:hypothetical protein QFC22_003348 [Naganishia vaughanmartiniae]|uniref:Uncharacterized protein n=1 Tax=Naganishia vaughanmartiniae TaxID=1424756 RepID=A0ACC2X8F9_9TREE|nr:hypothetical protein QFC22_003348 [Naganishia vaughanmartiniae]
MELAPTLETNGRHVKGGRRGSSSDNEKQTLSDVHREGFPTSFLHQNSFQHPLQSSQEGVGNPRSLKRTLLTTEEMAESDDDDVYDEGWEEGDVSEDEQMNQSWSSGNASPGPGYRPEIIQGDDGHDGTIDLRGQREVKNDSGSNRAGSGTILDTQSDHDEVETPNSTIDSGRVNSVDPTLAESSSSQVLAHKRRYVMHTDRFVFCDRTFTYSLLHGHSIRKKAIKYLEHIILDLLRQLVAITKLQLRQVRSEIGEGDASESESEKEELVENGVQKPSTVDETNVTGDEGGKGVPNVCIPLLNRATGNLKYLKYPGKAGQSDTSALSLARLLKVCELLHHALVEDIIVTKRDIYYKDVNLFGKQSVVDAVASPKGLVASSGLILLMKNDERKTVSATPTIIPSNGEIIEIQSVAPPRWALVIEKEATFTTLCKSGILADEELESGLLITVSRIFMASVGVMLTFSSTSHKGKGYPDLATLHFLKLLSESFPDCLIGILVDADPHGLDILSVYRYGSKKMRYTAEAEGLALGAKAEWLGVKATEWAQ